MLEAIEGALECILFRARYLSEDGLTCVVADAGGLARNSGEVLLILEHAAKMVVTYEGLLPKYSDEEDGSVHAVPAESEARQ
jgi:hypothetical protein